MSFEVILHGVKCVPVSAPTPEQTKKQIANLLDWFCQSPYYAKSDYAGFLNALPIHTVGGFGINTLCVEVTSENNSIIVNAGTGINSSDKLNKTSDTHLIFTSSNLSFFLGLSLFAPLYKPQSKVYIYSSIKNFKNDFIKNFNEINQAIKFDDLPCSIDFIDLELGKTVKINHFDVTPYALNKNSTDCGLLIKKNGFTYSQYIRSYKQSPGAAETIELYKNIDVMLHDGRGVLDYATSKITELPEALKTAVNNNVKKILFAQTDPWAEDDEISNRFLNSFDKLVLFLESQKANKISLDCSVAGEGCVLTLK